MSGQLTIAGQLEDPAIKLTERQRFALDLIGALGPIPSDELGAAMHQRRGRHSADDRCRWCCQEGKTLGGELRAKKLVKLRRGEGWVLRAAPKTGPARDSDYDPATAPFPEGF